MKTTTDSNTVAIMLYARLKEIKETAIPVLSRDRCIPRKEQAALARKLFKSLGLAGISVTTPNYSMAHVVEVRLPRAEYHDRQKWPHNHEACCNSGMGHNEATRCPCCRDHAAAELKIEEILARAFPNHDDRSDSMTDYFDNCWSVD